MKVLVIGTGAVGSFYGYHLAKAGAQVSVLARSDYDIVKTHGIHIDSPGGTFHFRPVHVVRSAAELPEKPDYAMLCVKVVEGADRVGLLRGAVGAGTAIVLLSNGIDIEREIAEAYPDNEIISALAFIAVTRIAPGKVSHQAYGNIALGSYPTGLSDKARRLAALFQQAGLQCTASEDITTARWQKCVWNAAFNPISVLSGLDTGGILASQEAFVRTLMAEVCSIAQAEGHPLPETLIDKSIHSTRKMPPYKTSMLVDFEAGQPLETEAILGNAVRAAQRAGVPVPHLESIYALMKLKEIAAARPASAP